MKKFLIANPIALNVAEDYSRLRGVNRQTVETEALASLAKHVEEKCHGCSKVEFRKTPDPLRGMINYSASCTAKSCTTAGMDQTGRKLAVKIVKASDIDGKSYRGLEADGMWIDEFGDDIPPIPPREATVEDEVAAMLEMQPDVPLVEGAGAW